MNRRTLIRNTLLLGLTAISRRSLAGILPENTSTFEGFHEFTLGNLKLKVITDGHLLYSTVQPHFAPNVPHEEVTKLLESNFQSDSADLGINVLYIESGTKRILIDTGCGSNFGDATGRLAKNLPKAGIAPTSITDIVLSHAHPDHLGGVLTKEGNLIFPNAKIYIAQREYDFWTAPNPDLSKCKITDQQLKAFVIRLAADTLKKVKPALHLFNDGDTLLDCIRVNIAAGHTPGHTLTTIFSQGQQIVHVADLVHSPLLVFAHPEWGFEGDTDFDEAIVTRRKVLTQLAQDRTQVFSYHLPWPGLGHVRKKDEGFEWVQNEFALPD